MNNLKALGKTSEFIGKILFYLAIIASIFVVISFNLSKTETNPEISIIIGSILGNILAVILIYNFWKLLFQPIYSLNKNVQLLINKELTNLELKKRWIFSLVSSLVFGLLFIVGTLGISFLLMIPHYILLIKTKDL